MVDRGKFWNVARGIFGGPSQHQVDGTNAILDGFEKRYPHGDLRWLAYELATPFWETDKTMQPIEEYGRGAGHPYGVPDMQTGQIYYGRGYVQLTWKANYDKLGQLLHIDLLNHPEKALEPTVAADIMFIGMERALFTGVGLPRYFNATTDDPVNARRIINGTDHAADIAFIHQEFLAALS